MKLSVRGGNEKGFCPELASILDKFLNIDSKRCLQCCRYTSMFVKEDDIGKTSALGRARELRKNQVSTI